MYPKLPLLSLALALYQGVTTANPVALGGASTGGCTYDRNVYSVDKNQVQGPGAPVTGDFSCAGTGTCQLSAGGSFTTGVTIEVGASLELELSKIVTAGVEASVAITTETGKVQGVQANCPDGPWTCSLIIHPTVVTVTGLQTDQDAMCKKLGPGKPYTVQFPVKGPDGIYEANVDVCVCNNYPHFADNGAPPVQCPGVCP